ncbi:MAG: hypothetical protein WAT43_19110 [Chitinophagales bacterium]
MIKIFAIIFGFFVFESCNRIDLSSESRDSSTIKIDNKIHPITNLDTLNVDSINTAKPFYK